MNNTVIFGRNPVIEALKADLNIDTVYISGQGGSLRQICAMAREKNIVVKNVTAEKLNKMAGNSSHQGVAAEYGYAETASVSDILASAKAKGKPPFIIICDDIQDPNNLGAIIRTAEAAGADGVIIPKRHSASVNHTVFKTSAGAASWLPIARVPNLARAIDDLKENGVWIYGADMGGEMYTEVDFRSAAAFVIGSEGYGLGRLITEKCDFLVRLPMNGKISSLNASVAAGIFMYECVRQRQTEPV